MTINFVAVLVCAIASMIVGFVWYGPLFGKAWMEIMGAATMSPQQQQSMKKSMGAMYALQFVLSLITAGVLDYVILHWADLWVTETNTYVKTSALCIAVIVWFGFILTTHASGALWSGKPKKVAWKMFLISAGAQLVTFVVFGIILGMWK